MKKNQNTEQIRSLLNEEFMEHGFSFWFNDHDHIRSPFPAEIHESVRQNTTDVFVDWLLGQKEKDIKKMSEQEVVEMFETIMFNEAIKLVENEDQQLIISYPFLPRIGDRVKDHVHGEGMVSGRKAIMSKDNKKILQLNVTPAEGNAASWTTEIELTA